jgi:3-methyladenine DNA glycosylase AlkD
MDPLVSQVRRELRENTDEKKRRGAQAYFKEGVTCLGVGTATVHRIARERIADLKGMTKGEVFGLCEELWRAGSLEETIVACDWSYFIRRQYVPGDITVFAGWVGKYVNNWASCDTLCNHSVGELLEMYPERVADLKQWARSRNRWLRRGAAVSLIIPAKKGKFPDDVMQIADILLEDPDDLVQKGYGWMLKVASQARQKEIYAYVMRNKAAMPRTALRYAIEKMPAELKRRAMKKQA